MPQTRPRGLTGSVTTGTTADPYTHARALTLSHTQPRARSVVWVVGAVSFGKAAAVRRGSSCARGMAVGWDGRCGRVRQRGRMREGNGL